MSKKGRAFKYTRFSRFASKEGITDHELLKAVEQLEVRLKNGTFIEIIEEEE